MQLAFSSDEFDRLVATVEHGSTSVVVTCSDLPQGAADLKAAYDDAVRDGVGECYWREAAGEYRWVFRVEKDKIRIAILWSNGTLTGWENVLWAEVDAVEFGATLRESIKAVEFQDQA